MIEKWGEQYENPVEHEMSQFQAIMRLSHFLAVKGMKVCETNREELQSGSFFFKLFFIKGFFSSFYLPAWPTGRSQASTHTQQNSQRRNKRSSPRWPPSTSQTLGERSRPHWSVQMLSRTLKAEVLMLLLPLQPYSSHYFNWPEKAHCCDVVNEHHRAFKAVRSSSFGVASAK